MNDQMHTGIAEATRLTQQGRLDEVTAAIQRGKVQATQTSR
jgi:hypothetical protein